MLAFRALQNPYGFIPILHRDYFMPILKRYFLFESFSKTKTQEFYKNFYQTDLIKKAKNKEINEDMNFIISKAPIRDKLVSIFYITFILTIIIGIFYSFLQ